jgi:two-component system sensor histidine kinase SenX3
VVSTVLLVGLVALLTLVIGAAFGARLAPRLSERRQRRSVTQSGITVSQMLAHIVSQSPVGIVVVDTYRDVVYHNDRARELGLVRDRLLDDRAWLAAERTLATGDDGEVDLSPRKRAHPGRSGLSVRGHVRLLTEQDRRFAVVYVDDQSEHARMEATRRDFVANVSHELKTPVGAVGLLAEAVLDAADDPAEVHRFASRILTESTRLGALVTELIALSRLTGAERLPELSAVDVDDLVAETVEIAVTDRGIGIAPQHQARVFERFFRVDPARSRATGGTGLGLAIVKHVLANHGGHVRLWSSPGTGSTFTMCLPARLGAVAATVAEPGGHA